MDRRSFLKGVAVAGAAGAATQAVPAVARDKRTAPADAVGMLYDATLCIGCKTCVVKCREANGMKPQTQASGGLWDQPTDLDGDTRNIIKLFKDGERSSYMKAQCMHCIDPGCVGACMLGSLQKRELGVVTWKGEYCIGCRYCAVACQYTVPKFEWWSATPNVVKCEMCSHRLAEGKQPACCEVCPRQAVIFGKYTDLLAAAKARLAREPGRYEPRVFGETEGGGTQVLYLSKKGIRFEELGLPALGDEPTPELAQTIQHGIYKGFIAPVALFAAAGLVTWKNRGKGEPGGGT
jgi:Fe-S-cluster-containing dehydrogenase component